MPVYNQNAASFRVFQDSRQGGRKYMEDIVCINSHKSENGEHDFLYFAIFDGHGGAEAARFAKDHLLDELKNFRGFWTQDKEQITKAIKEAFLSTHKLMWKNVGLWPKTLSGLPSTSGTTASVVIIKGGHVYIAHVGDSSIVIGEENYWRTLQANCVTVDHKPESPAELKRIEESGGRVMSKAGVQRVVWHRPRPAHKGPIRRSTHIDDIPFLAVARALGDLWSYNSERDTFVVSPEPDITVYKFDHKKHKFIIVASDGLWNMVKPEESVGYVEQLVEEEEAFSLVNNPARKLVQLALNKWAFRNMRADNTSVIAVMVDPPMTDDEFNVSRSNSRASSASTVRLSEADTDIMSDQDLDIGVNIDVAGPDNSRNSLPPIRPSPHHIGFFRQHPKHISSCGNHVSRTPSRTSSVHHQHERPKTPGSAPGRCSSEKMYKLHKSMSLKRRGHSFWASGCNASPSDRIVIPTKYKSPEERKKVLTNTHTEKSPQKEKKLTPTKYRSPEDQAKKPVRKPQGKFWLVEGESYKNLPDYDPNSPVLTPSKYRGSGGNTVDTMPVFDDVNICDEVEIHDKDTGPVNISQADGPNGELPLLNKVILPSKYKSSAATTINGSSPDVLEVSTRHPAWTAIRNRSKSDASECNISKISPLQATKVVTGGKRKASMSALDCSNLSAKKAKRSHTSKSLSEPAGSVQASRKISVSDSASSDHIVPVKSGSPKMALSAKSPLKVNTCQQDSPSTAICSPIWPSCLDKDIDLDTDAGDDLCTFPVSGSQVCRAVRENVPNLNIQNHVNYARLSKKSFGAQNVSCRIGGTKHKSKTQGSRITVKTLRLRSKRPMKLRNTTHRTRLQVKATVSRKS